VFPADGGTDNRYDLMPPTRDKPAFGSRAYAWQGQYISSCPDDLLTPEHSAADRLRSKMDGVMAMTNLGRLPSTARDISNKSLKLTRYSMMSILIQY